jgi:hypothetical protein
MMKATELSTKVTKSTIRTNWTVKRWIIFQIAGKAFHFSTKLT